MKWPFLLRLTFLMACACGAQSVGVGDALPTELEQEAPHLTAMLRSSQPQRQKTVSEQHRRRVALPPSASQHSRTAVPHPATRLASQAIPVSADPFRHNLLIAVCALLVLWLAIRKYAPQLAESVVEHLTAWPRLPASARVGARALVSPDGISTPAEELEPPERINDPARQVLLFPHEESTAFPQRSAFPGFRKAAPVPELDEPAESVTPETDLEGADRFLESEDPDQVVHAFLAEAAPLLADLRSRLQVLTEAVDAKARRNCLTDLQHRVEALARRAGRAGLPSIFQLASAVESLLKKLAQNPDHATPSTLHTLAQAVELLRDLAVAGPNAKLVSDPPPRMLVVDDDPMARRAISYALQVAFEKPDSAPDGPAALDLVGRNTYEVIFADVQMPGMDGFALCSKIHESVLNSHTPVVFVTCQSDDESRAQAAKCGGADFIAKPFLLSEITLKALTLILRRRFLLAQAAEPGEVTETGTPAARRAPLSNRLKEHDTEILLLSSAGTPEPTARSVAPATRLPRKGSSMDLIESKSQTEMARDFAAKGPEFVADLRALLQQLAATSDTKGRAELFVDLRYRVRALSQKAGAAGLLPVSQLGSALENLLKKLFENPENANLSILNTISHALDLLRDLCLPSLDPQLATNPPPRMLVVDDDPLARRAVSYAIQVAFDKPDSAENGRAALELVGRNRYEAIFVDVQMPGLDGFELCSKIHETVPNSETPVVFVTCHADEESRAKAARCGGTDFIAKPFLLSEITLKALTLVLRQRLLFSSRSFQTEILSRSPRITPNADQAGQYQEVLVLAPHAPSPPGLVPIPANVPGRASTSVSTVTSPTDLGSWSGQASSFLAGAAPQIEVLRKRLVGLMGAKQEDDRRKRLVELRQEMESFCRGVALAQLQPVSKLASALDGLLKKLAEQPQQATASTLNTLARALHLLQEVCGPDAASDLALPAAVRLLVVDDDAMARRAISYALQVAFGKPDNAPDGPAALALAERSAYDVIFADVQMPGMDGFTLCSKIHDTTPNASTPVVFVTCQADDESRAQAVSCGGADFIAKPFLLSEITLKALTLSLQARIPAKQQAA